MCLECLQMWKVDRTVYSSSENSSLSSYPYSSSDWQAEEEEESDDEYGYEYGYEDSDEFSDDE